MKRIEGFANQRMHVVPRPQVREALGRPVTRRLLVTDAGMFPEARNHERVRPEGTPETIVLICTAGSGWVETAASRAGVGAGTAVIIPGGTPHRYASSERSPWTIWWCHVAGTDVPELVAETGATADRPTIALKESEKPVALIDEIITAMERDISPIRLLGAAGNAWKLLTQIAVDRTLPERGDPLERAMTYIQERLDGAIKVPDLAAMLGISASHLSALFRSATGGGVLAYHTGLRMARARTLLDATALPVSTIATSLGFHDPLYFSRQFRKVHGLSPSQYREQHKG
ncbi:AraC family transcriptional regulator [Leifsonia sp. LS1]|uniref:AraC family transcriptional regulator n=1 Tax=unclassified Leifsonia TaxID=2663824 RepID=UPI001CC0B2E4|nr:MULTISPECIES: AraC family transcriptional regulator [unclassified Leifsonia]UAJ79785.1 AraC family transcriptional regulator [Leifsonia sp. ZF2019]GIT81326.1 AraC family transcriptional regulator [Leifsonia sp. LS1]